MKKILMALGVVFIFCFLGFVGIALFLNAEIENHKDPSFIVANNFMNCLYNDEDPAKCIDKFVHRTDRAQFKDDEIRNLVTVFKTKLGKRGISGTNDDSWNMKSQMNINKANESLISFTAKTMYTNDISATERFSVMLVDGKYYIKKAHVDSKAFYK